MATIAPITLAPVAAGRYVERLFIINSPSAISELASSASDR